jgi:hypothetical protein
MTPLLWTGMGIALGVAVLHVALGARRPFERTYLSFAGIMAAAAVFLYLRAGFYSVTTVADAIEIQRDMMTTVNVCFACMFVFVPAYTRVRIHRIAMVGYWAALITVSLVNLRAPYSIWFSDAPALVPSTFRGEPYTAVVAPPMGLVQYAYLCFSMASLIVALVFTVKMFRCGDRQRAVTFALALLIVLAFASVDAVRDSTGGAWPNVVEFGIVSWGLVMSVQLAHDFRTQRRALAAAVITVEGQSTRLAEIVAALHALEQNMHIPLETLERGVAGLASGTRSEEQQLRRIERAVSRLHELAGSMPDLRARRRVRSV